MTATLKSPINRMGGKHLLTGWLNQYIPEHTAYVEPFCGAGHLLFFKESSPVEILNDIDSYLIVFFQVIKDHEKRQKLIETLQYMPYSREPWNEIRSQWKAGNLPQNEIERAARWYYLNRTTFAGDQTRGGFAVPSTTGRNPVQSFRNAVDSLDVIAGRLRNVCIENLDYQECIKRYDSPETLFYIDCPYYGSENYYGDPFSHEDHHRLAELLHGIKGQVMVSHYSNELYDELYQGWNRYEYASFKGSHKADPGTEKPFTLECLYTNFETVKNRSLFNENVLV